MRWFLIFTLSGILFSPNADSQTTPKFTSDVSLTTNYSYTRYNSNYYDYKYPRILFGSNISFAYRFFDSLPVGINISPFYLRRSVVDGTFDYLGLEFSLAFFPSSKLQMGAGLFWEYNIKNNITLKIPVDSAFVKQDYGLTFFFKINKITKFIPRLGLAFKIQFGITSLLKTINALDSYEKSDPYVEHRLYGIELCYRLSKNKN